MTDKSKNTMIRRSFLRACAVIWPASVLTKVTVAHAKDVIVSIYRGDRGKLFDANGRTVKYCVEANLTTGRCVVFKTRSGIIILNNRRDGAEQEVIHRPAPMRFISKGE